MRHIFTLLLLLLVASLGAHPQAPIAPPDQVIAGAAHDAPDLAVLGMQGHQSHESVMLATGGTFEIGDAGLAPQSPAQGFPSVRVGSYVAEGASSPLSLYPAASDPCLDTPAASAPAPGSSAASRCTGCHIRHTTPSFHPVSLGA